MKKKTSQILVLNNTVTVNSTFKDKYEQLEYTQSTKHALVHVSKTLVCIALLIPQPLCTCMWL
jgi:hypothetical protein